MDTRFTNQVGTSKQHSYACDLASKAGYGALRYALADWAGVSVSKTSKLRLDAKAASSFITWLQDR